MPPSMRQTNFGAGELSPELWGRTDLPIFSRGLRACRNFFLTHQGAAKSRPGTTYVATTKHAINPDGSAVGPDKARLIPFSAGDDVSYALLFGHKSIRFFADGAPVELVPGTPYEVVTPYQLTELPLLKYAQTGDVLTIVSPNHDARELRILTPVSWTLTVVDFTPPTPAYFIPALASNRAPDLQVDRTTLSAVDPDHPSQEWEWGFTALLKQKSTGATIESTVQMVVNTFASGGGGPEPISVAIPNNLVVLYSDKPIYLAFSLDAAPLDPSYELVGFNIYRGRAGLLGFLAQTVSGLYTDVGDLPDYSKQPPVGTLPFGTDMDGAEHVNRPSVVGFFDERRVFDDGLKAGLVHLSATGDYFNYDVHDVEDVAGEAINLTLAARKREEVRALLPRQRLLIFTGASVWSLGGSQGSAIDFDDIDARVEDENGATHLQPIVAEGAALYARAKGVGVRALVSQGQQYGYTGVDVSQIAQHLFLGVSRTLVDWCYAQDPWGLVWAVLADGSLLSLTYSGDGWGWARHDTDGLVESICCIPEGEEDAVYLVVHRTVDGASVRYVERMTSRVLHYPEGNDAEGNKRPDPPAQQLYPDNVCVDAAFEYSGAATTEFTGLDHLEGKEVYVLARGMPPAGPFTVDGGEIVDVWDEDPPNNALDGTGTPTFVAYVGLLYTPELETLDIAAGDARLRKKTLERIGFEVDNSVGLSVGQGLDAELDEWIQRDVADAFHAVSMATALVDMPVESAWDQSARAALRQTSPLPVTVVGLTRALAVDE